MRIASVGSALPHHYYDQETLLKAFRELWSKRYFNTRRLEQLHRNVLVGGRHLDSQAGLDNLAQNKNIAVADIFPVASQLDRDAVGSGHFGQDGGLGRIRFAQLADLAERRNRVSVSTLPLAVTRHPE